MKTFTYPQKKWLMTGALLAVLGLNISFNTSQTQVSTADFASSAVPKNLAENRAAGIRGGEKPTEPQREANRPEQPEFEEDDEVLSGPRTETPSNLLTQDGEVHVDWVRKGQSTIAYVTPTTEGKTCETCPATRYILPASYNIIALKIALLKAMADNRKVPPQAQEEAEAEENVAEEAPQKKSPFARIERMCKNDSDKLNCYTRQYFIILKNSNRSRKISAADALIFFTEEIQPKLLEGASENPPLDHLAQLITNIPQKYENVRSAVFQTQEQILKQKTVVIGAMKLAGKEPLEILNAQNSLYSLYGSLRGSNNTALYNAVQLKNTTSDSAAAYEKAMADYFSVLNSSITTTGGSPTESQIKLPEGIKTRLSNSGRGGSTLGAETKASIGKVPTLAPPNPRVFGNLLSPTGTQGPTSLSGRTGQRRGQ